MNAPVPHVRILTLQVPAGGTAVQEFELLESEGMTLLCALKQLGNALPPALQNAFVCHAGACNTCRVLIDGKPGVACTTFTRDLGSTIAIAPGEHAAGWDGLRDDGRRVHG